MFVGGSLRWRLITYNHCLAYTLSTIKSKTVICFCFVFFKDRRKALKPSFSYWRMCIQHMALCQTWQEVDGNYILEVNLCYFSWSWLIVTGNASVERRAASYSVGVLGFYRRTLPGRHFPLTSLQNTWRHAWPQYNAIFRYCRFGSSILFSSDADASVRNLTRMRKLSIY